MDSNISFSFWITVIIIIAAALGFFYFYYAKKREGKKEDPTYLKALKYMAEGDNRNAVQKFKEAVRQDSKNIDAYIKLGIILRKEGLYNNAIRIHKDITLRGNLSKEEEIETLKNLAIDYWCTKEYDKAEKYFNEIKSEKSLIDWITGFLIKIYEMKKEWEKAFDVLSQSSMANTEKGKKRLAMYKIMHGLNISVEDEKAARVLFKDAIKIDKSCAAAYLYLGDSYLREDRASDGIKSWTDLCQKVPDKAYLTFERLEKAWYEKGQFSKIEELYQSMLSENEDNFHAIIALAEIYRKKGEYNESLKLLHRAEKKDIDINLIKAHIIKVLFDKAEFKEASKLTLELIEADHQPAYKRFKCDSCNFESNEPFWICSKCNEWDSK